MSLVQTIRKTGLSPEIDAKAAEMAVLMRDPKFKAEVLEKLSSSLYGTNETFPEPMTSEELMSYPMVNRLWRMLSHNLAVFGGPVTSYRNLALIGRRGFGKTKIAQALVECLSEIFESAGLLRISAIFVPMQFFSMESMTMIMRGETPEGMAVADSVLIGKFAEKDTLKLIMFDEAPRGGRQGWNAKLGVLSTGMVAGVRVPGYLGAIATGNNTRADGATRMPDFRTARRYQTMFVDSKSAPYFRHFADLWPDKDLTALSSWYYSAEVTESMRETLNARTLLAILGHAFDSGTPLIWGLPIIGDQRARIERMRLTGEGRHEAYDVTDETLAKLASLLGVSDRRELPGQLGIALDRTLEHGGNLLIIGKSGAGKTALLQSIAEDYEVFTMSAADSDPENYLVMAADEAANRIEILAARALVDRKKLLLYIEEVTSPSSKAIADRIGEITGERTIGGIKLPIHAIVAVSNPSKQASGISANVTAMDHALASRFNTSIFLRDDDIDHRAFLESTYGEDIAGRVCDWASEDLPDDAKEYVPAAVQESLCIEIDDYARENGGDLSEITVEDLKMGLAADWSQEAYYAEEYLVRLVERLVGLKLARLSDILNEAECPGGCDHGGWLHGPKPEGLAAQHCDLPFEQAGYICKLGRGLAELPTQSHVCNAITSASMTLLQARREELLPLVCRLYPQYRTVLITWKGEEERVLFYQDLVCEAVLGEPAPPVG